MEYTKDVILHINYGQEVKHKRRMEKLFEKVLDVIAKHKWMTIVVSVTFLLMALDMMLVTSFVQVLSTMN